MFRLLLLAALSTPAWAGSSPPEITADGLAIDPDRITVSGISAGAMMAHQLHVAYSELFSGAAAIAGGPYGCAEGSLATAMARCMASSGGGLPVAELAAALRSDAEAGRIAPPERLADDRVWLFHGRNDTVVAAGVSDALAALYAEFVPPENLSYVDGVPAAHHFPADGRGHACGASQSPFVGDCGYDAAGTLLQFLYPGLQAPVEPVAEALTSLPLTGGPEAGLSETAHLYVPAACKDGNANCALHLVLHGCAQSASQIGTAFIEQSGYLPWAEANSIVLAFPQVEPAALNPYACWDWWGYTGPQYRWRDGTQTRVLAEWMAGLAGRELP
jgi:poly(3-hydroxybutyrate) depolymerase